MLGMPAVIIASGRRPSMLIMMAREYNFPRMGGGAGVNVCEGVGEMSSVATEVGEEVGVVVALRVAVGSGVLVLEAKAVADAGGEVFVGVAVSVGVWQAEIKTRSKRVTDKNGFVRI